MMASPKFKVWQFGRTGLVCGEFLMMRFVTFLPLRLCRWLVPSLICFAAGSGVDGAPILSASPSSDPPLKEIEPGVFALGEIRLDKKAGSIQFPAAVNMREGMVEYWLVGSGGKLHESVLSTELEPYQIHVAMLLLGIQTAQPPDLLSGDNIQIRVSWTADDREIQRTAEELVSNLQTGKSMSPGPWNYTGSRMIEGLFVAQRDRSIVSTIEDPDALVNNPRPGRENDEIWEANPATVPPVGTAVRVTFQLLKK
jgi:hypothetical protein